MNKCEVKGELGIGRTCEFWNPDKDTCLSPSFCMYQIAVEETSKRMVTVHIPLYLTAILNAYVGKDMEILSASVNESGNELMLVGKDNWDEDVEEITILSCLDGTLVPSNWHYLTSYTPPNYGMRHLFLDVPGG